MAKFTFPNYFNFPPMFTLQVVEETRKKQLIMWRDLIISYAEFHKKYEFNIEKECKSDLFNNKKISRNLSEKSIRKIFSEMVKEGYGCWETKDKKVCILTHKTIEDWSQILYEWATNEGLLNKICTIYALRSDDDYDTEFTGIHQLILLKVVKLLEKREKVALLEGDTLDEMGVKFREA